jgi:hypothetical protein
MCRSRHIDSFDMFIHVVRSVDWSQRPMHHHAGRPLPVIKMCGRLLSLLVTAMLKPLCLISIEDFPAVGKLHYSTANSSFHSTHNVHLTSFFFSFQSFLLPLCFQIIPTHVSLTNNDTVLTKPHMKLEKVYFTRMYTYTAYTSSSCTCYSSPMIPLQTYETSHMNFVYCGCQYELLHNSGRRWVQSFFMEHPLKTQSLIQINIIQFRQTDVSAVFDLPCQLHSNNR